MRIPKLLSVTFFAVISGVSLLGTVACSDSYNKSTVKVGNFHEFTRANNGKKVKKIIVVNEVVVTQDITVVKNVDFIYGITILSGKKITLSNNVVWNFNGKSSLYSSLIIDAGGVLEVNNTDKSVINFNNNALFNNYGTLRSESKNNIEVNFYNPESAALNHFVIGGQTVFINMDECFNILQNSKLDIRLMNQQLPFSFNVFKLFLNQSTDFNTNGREVDVYYSESGQAPLVSANALAFTADQSEIVTDIQYITSGYTYYIVKTLYTS